MQVSKEQFDKILQMCKQGEEQGAKLECGGKRLGDKGYYIEPTVFSNVQDDNIIATDEIFGPVQSILKWSTIEEVCRRGSDSEKCLTKLVSFGKLRAPHHSCLETCTCVVDVELPARGDTDTALGIAGFLFFKRSVL